MANVRLPQLSEMQNPDGSLEAQQVIAKQPTSAWIYTSTRYVPPGKSRVDYTFSVGDGSILIQKASRIECVEVGCANFNIPNINPRNNVIVWTSSVSGATYTTTLDEAYETTPAGMMNRIVLALNLITGVSGITFASFPTVVPGVFTLGGDFPFSVDPSCLMATKGVPLCSLQATGVMALGITVGPINLDYTPFVDVHSSTLTKYAKLVSRNAAGRAGLFVRAFQKHSGILFGKIYDDKNAMRDLSFAYRPREVITSIDFQLFDYNGDPLYIPAYLANVFDFRITIHYEL